MLLANSKSPTREEREGLRGEGSRVKLLDSGFERVEGFWSGEEGKKLQRIHRKLIVPFFLLMILIS